MALLSLGIPSSLLHESDVRDGRYGGRAAVRRVARDLHAGARGRCRGQGRPPLRVVGRTPGGAGRRTGSDGRGRHPVCWRSPLTLLVKALLVEMDLTARWAGALAGSMQRLPRATLGRRKHELSGDHAAAGTGTLTR